MALQGFVDQKGPPVSAAWLNAVDTVLGSGLAIGLIGLPMPANTAMLNGPPSIFGAQVGTAAAPSSNTQPMVSFTNYLSATSGPSNYAGGAGWFSTYVEGGTQFSKGVTGYIEIDGGTAISAVAVHGFGNIQASAPAGQSVWSGWFTSHDNASTVINQCFGVEIDLVLGANRPHVTNVIGTNAGVGLWINNQSDELNLGNFHGTAAIGITHETNGTYDCKWQTGIFFQHNSIVPGASNEAIQINGGSIAANSYAGLRLIADFNVGIDLSGGTFASPAYAILLPNGTISGGVIGFGDSVSGFYPGLYLNAAIANSLVIGQGIPGGVTLSTAAVCLSTLGINGNVGPAQSTGWGTPVNGAIIASYDATAEGGTNTTKAMAQVLTLLKSFGLLGA